MSAFDPYDSTTLKQYMNTVIDEVAVQLDWSVGGGQYDEPFTDVMLALNIGNLDDWVSNAEYSQIRAMARYQVWRHVAEATTGHYDVSSDLKSLKRSQMHAMALSNIAQAAVDLGSLGVSVASTFGTFRAPLWDPYRVDLNQATSEYGVE